MQASLIDFPNSQKFKEKIILKHCWEKDSDIASVDVEHYGRSVIGFGVSYRKICRHFLEIDPELIVKGEREGSLETIIDFLSKKEVIACATAMGLLQYFGLDFNALCRLPAYIFRLIIDIIKFSKGKKVEIKKFIDGLKLDEKIKEKLHAIFANIDFRSSLDELTIFLTIQGMKALSVEQDKCPKATISKAERSYFATQPEDEVTVDISEKIVSVTYLSPEKDRWQFKSKKFEFWATVTDKNFIENMNGKYLEDIADLTFYAKVKRTITKEANTKHIKTEREIYAFVPESKQAPLLL